ncbi:alpha-2-macroglobulin family protein [Psychroflexus aestuariivivens]|uniref:alpha-2-macroglobulin family protein n=1 Tax=Psychroflexus aestuariivivens TaxID=1795040 RepID=UPI000FD9DCE2|nr:MG2 domain-containing protein [Psychroflexus aestuariivivens]
MKNFLILLICLLSLNLFAQKKYDKLWDKIEILETKDHSKDAYELVLEIYDKAKRKNNQKQAAKAFIYKSKFELMLKENSENDVYQAFLKEIKSQKFPFKQILTSHLAESLNEYYNSNYYKIRRRSETNRSSEDFTTWSENKLYHQIDSLYQESLNPSSKLQKIEDKDYKDFLKIGDNYQKFRTSIYDILANRYIEFLEQYRQPSEFKSSFKPEDSIFLATTKNFIKLNINTEQSTASIFKQLKIYQNLETFHWQNNSELSVFSLALERLEFLKNNGDFGDKTVELYIKSLQSLKNEFDEDYSKASILLKLAEYHEQFANKENYPDFNKKSVKLAEECIETYPESQLSSQARKLIKKIKFPDLEITSQEIISPNQMSKVLVNFKNIDSLDLEIYKLSAKNSFFDEISKYDYKQRESIIKSFFESNTAEISKTYKLPNQNDYFNYSTEVLIPELEKGQYVLKFSEKSNSDVIYDEFKYQIVKVSDLAFQILIKDNFIDFQLVERLNGKPIENAQVHLEFKKKRSDKSFVKPTNNNGIARFNFEEPYQPYQITFIHNQDTLSTKDSYSKPYERQASNSDEGLQIFAQSITDRSIYRPGQEVFFKTFVHSIEENQTSAVEDFSVQILLLDQNQDVLDSLQLKTNEFGSVHGKFKIPRGRNLGQYSIEIDEDFDNNDSFYDKYDYFDFEAKTANFNVEEYKRPKFEVDINDLKTTYKLNDSINISGKAQAFFGGNVSNAKVEFTVERRMNYNPLYRQTRYFESVEPERIAAGEVETDQDGNFEIIFKAEPDRTVDKKFLPIFVYQIKASVTDINGETRTAEKNINIGYHGLNIDILTENEITEGQNQEFQITANDLNKNKKNIEDTLKIYRFKSLDRKLKYRPWSPPEIQQIPFEQFTELFPHEAYDQNELEKLNEIDTLVSQIIVDTDKKNIFNYDEKLNLESGKYQLKIETKDEFGIEIEAKQNINYTSKTDAELPQETFTLEAESLENSNGKFAQLNMQSDAEELYVFLEISNQNGFYERRFYTLKTKLSKQIKLPDNTEKAQIQWSYIYGNQWQSNSRNIDFKTKNSSIQVEVISHRNKLEPGSDETWSLKVTDDTKNPVAAEVVASMYDASLDDFRPHQWRVKFEKEDYNLYKTFGNSNIYSRVFSISSFTTLNRSYFSYRRSLAAPTLVKLENFGYDFTNPFEAQNEYVKKLIAKLKTKIKFKNGTVSGYVYDEDGLPVPGANILIKGTNRGTQTDFDGFYVIKANKGDELIAESIGYATQTTTIYNSGINFTLKVNSESLDEVIVTGYDDESSFAMKGAVSGIQVEDAEASPTHNSSVTIRGNGSISGGKTPLYVVDGEIVSGENFRNLNPNNIAEVNILKGEEATSLYGSRGANGVILISSKSGDAELEAALKQIKPRKDLKETAFFMPQLSTDKNGEVIFNFESPEALTKWKFQALAHDKKMRSHRTELNVVTQKKLNISPNFPRFFRSGDRIFISAKITNLTDEALNGMAQLSFKNEITQESINIINSEDSQRVNIPAKGSKNVSFELKIPENIEAVRYKIIAKAGQFTDGQEDVIPVLSNKVLITETLPIWVEPNSKTDFTFSAMKNNDSETLVHKSLTFNYNMNPIWTALEALPYTMDFPHECSEQTFAKLYSNLLSVKILNTHPDVQNILKQWRDSENETGAMFENEELKQILIEETPWLQEALDDDAQRKQLSKLLDKDKNEQNIQELISKLNAMQLPNGAFPWFSGGHKNFLISQHILAGFGHLEQLEAFDIENSEAENMVKKLVMFLDKAYQDDENKKTEYQTLHYLYSRSFFKTYNKPTITKLAAEFLDAHQDDWISFSFSQKLLFALISNRFGYDNLAKTVLEALEQNAVIETDKGMYWKENFTNYNWQNSAIENQALAVEAFREILEDQQKTNLLKQWLIHSKRKAAWPTTKATTEAIYALMLSGKSWTTSEKIPSIKLGDISIEISEEERQSKRIKKVFSAENIQPEMANIEIKNKSDSPQFGGIFWQYLENLDNVKSSSSEYLQVEKEWFVVKQTSDGENMIRLQNESLKIGDLVRIQLTIKAKDDFNFIHLKDLRASTFEPTDVISEYKYKDGLRFYQVTKDASTNFFIDDLPRGTYILEYDLRANQNGDFTGGHSNLQSMYAPEFSARTKGGRILVEK